jgi:beta-glucanase (GH16 family)
MTIAPVRPRARQSRVGRRLAIVVVAAIMLTATVVISSPAGAATCNPLAALLHMCARPPAPATPPTSTPSYFSMEKGLPAGLGLDPAYAPSIGIPAPAGSAAASTPATAAPCGGVVPLKANRAPWRCTFADEFSGTSLNPAKWSPQLTTSTGFTSGTGAGTACYVNNPGNISVGGGALALTVRKESTPVMCLNGNSDFRTYFTAGGVTGIGKFSQAYGRFDVRAAFPATTLRGLQSSLWLWPNDPFKYGAWPSSGEIDLAEYYTSRPGFMVPTVHYYPAATRNVAKGINTTTNAFCHFDQPSQFHNYTLIWTPSLLSVYYDGTLCLFDHWQPASMTAPAPFDSPFFVTLTSALGIGANSYTAATQLPATTKIDYVRVYA